ncbi:MAG: hypothetical protein H0W67_00905 [Gemmatimonadales bacterium]|nr:hypothetical protein [Gemmatimonadales bacterium]
MRPGLVVPVLHEPFAESELVDQVVRLVRSAQEMRQRARQQAAAAAESRTIAGRHQALSVAQRARSEDLLGALARLRLKVTRLD